MRMFELLDSFGLPWFRQGSAPQELPETFVTEWEFDRELFLEYNNTAQGITGIFSICLYTSDPSKLKELDRFCQAAKQAVFIIRKLPRDIASGIEEFYGRQCEIYDIESNQI